MNQSTQESTADVLRKQNHHMWIKNPVTQDVLICLEEMYSKYYSFTLAQAGNSEQTVKLHCAASNLTVIDRLRNLMTDYNTLQSELNKITK